MPSVARKIARTKWLPPSFGADEIAADALSGCLRTASNGLSFWRIREADDPWWSEVALALASGLNRLETIHVVRLDEERLVADQTIADTVGKTPIASLRDRHFDMERLDVGRLRRVAEVIATAVRAPDADTNIKILTEAQVRKMLADAVEGGRVTIDGVNEGLRPEISAELRKRQRASRAPLIEELRTQAVLVQERFERYLAVLRADPENAPQRAALWREYESAKDALSNLERGARAGA